MNSLVAKAVKVPEEGWTMQDGTMWPGNNVHDHPGMIQVRISIIYEAQILYKSVTMSIILLENLK